MTEFRHYRQLITDGGAGGVPGDCFRTCIGMCIGLPPDHVPHFVDPDHFADWRAAARRWLGLRGFDLIELPYPNPQEVIIDQLRRYAHHAPVMLSGWGKGGDLHSVVVYQGNVYDPHPSDAGLCGPHPVSQGSEIGYYWLRIIAPRPSRT